MMYPYWRRQTNDLEQLMRWRNHMFVHVNPGRLLVAVTPRIIGVHYYPVRYPGDATWSIYLEKHDAPDLFYAGAWNVEQLYCWLQDIGALLQ